MFTASAWKITNIIEKREMNWRFWKNDKPFYDIFKHQREAEIKAIWKKIEEDWENGIRPTLTPTNTNNLKENK